MYENQVKECESLIDDPEMGNEAKNEIFMLESNIEECREKLLVSMIPPDPEIGKNIIVEIRAGAGGDEASIFASDLYRMYTRFAEKLKWTIECLSQSNLILAVLKK